MVQFPAGQKIFLFEMFRSALVPTHPPLQCIMGYFFPGVGWLQCEADHTPLSSAEVKNV